MIENILLGISTVCSYQNIILCLIGCVVGTIISILPGIGVVTTLSILIPFTYSFGPTASIIMMAGIYYGAQYGGSTTAILTNVPGEISSIVTCLDGHSMAKKGQAGEAIVTAGISSFIAGIMTTIFVALFASTLSSIAFSFGPSELSLIMLLGIFSMAAFVSSNFLIGIGAGLIGILLGLIGTDIATGTRRFTFGMLELTDGIELGAFVIGIFGLTELIKELFKENYHKISSVQIKFSKSSFKRMLPSTARGTMVGMISGLIPGGGSVLGTFLAYSLEKKVSKNKLKLGTGIIEGVAAPEAANNAAAQSGMIPLVSMGIPENAVTALILSGLIMAGIQPGPGLITRQPDLFWGLIISMLIGNIFLLILNVSLVDICIKLLLIPKKYLYPLLILIILYGVYQINNSWFDVEISLVFCLFGLVLIWLGIDLPPMIFGFIIGPMFEEHFRRSLIISGGDPFLFFKSGISKLFALFILGILVLKIIKFRHKIF